MNSSTVNIYEEEYQDDEALDDLNNEEFNEEEDKVPLDVEDNDEFNNEDDDVIRITIKRSGQCLCCDHFLQEEEKKLEVQNFLEARFEEEIDAEVALFGQAQTHPKVVSDYIANV